MSGKIGQLAGEEGRETVRESNESSKIKPRATE